MDPPSAAQRWAAVLGIPDPGQGSTAVVDLPGSGQLLQFVPAQAGRGEGITAVTIAGIAAGAPIQIGGMSFVSARAADSA